VLILARDETSPEDRLAEEMRARGAEVDFRRVPGFAPMVMNEVHDSVVPDEVFAVATRWLEEDPAAAPRPAAAAVPEAGPPACVLAVDGARVTEEAVCFGPDARLFGILTRSAASDPARPAVVFLNNGAVHRVGSQRMYVSMAREWAARGWTTLRMDLSGLGDSRPSPGRGENVMYAGDAVDDVRAGLEWLATTHGHRRFVLLGLCAGAHASFHAALSGGNVAGIVLINPQTFYFKEGDPLDVAPSEVYSRWQKYQGSFWSREKWTKLMRGAVPLRDLAGVMLARARIIATARGSAVVRAVRRRHRGTLSGDLPALVRTGTDVFMVFSARDPGLDYIELHARSEVRALLGLPNFGIEIIEGPDHTFTPVWSQRRLLEVVTARLVQRHAGRA
jgi:alpha/beta superfamily hydrolase